MSSHTKKAKSGKANADTDLSASNMSDSQRQHYIEVGAYHIAQKNGLNSSCNVENWLAAEAEIDLLLAGGKSSNRN